MARLIIDGNKVYTIDEECMRKKNLTLTQVKQLERHEPKKDSKHSRRND